MSEETVLTKSYLALFKFLLMSKRNITIESEKLKITPIQAITLLLLDKPSPMHSFTKMYHCDPSNTTGIMDGLEKKKLVGRFECPDDRRVKMIKITPTGNKIRGELLLSQTGDDSDIVKKLTPSELSTFIDLVKKISS